MLSVFSFIMLQTWELTKHSPLQRQCDHAKPSLSIKTKEGREWLSLLPGFESILDKLLELVAPKQHRAGLEAQEKLLKDDAQVLSEKERQILKDWPSVFTGIAVISNRITPPHRDRGGSIFDYDILASNGTHEKATLEIRDAGVTFAYEPGVVILLLGKLLQHAVPSWKGGERVCFAHFMKTNVLDRYSKTQRDWVTMDDFSLLM